MWLKREEEESLKRNVLVRILIFLKNGGEARDNVEPPKHSSIWRRNRRYDKYTCEVTWYNDD
ncbi:unnamed protein product [marine sediment metagenome]|uniref:Uncharacterized protein n=1 Tax=marine sediment metagenome TaxID=412755 RepID=X1IVI0_9ZZZZ